MRTRVAPRRLLRVVAALGFGAIVAVGLAPVATAKEEVTGSISGTSADSGFDGTEGHTYEVYLLNLDGSIAASQEATKFGSSGISYAFENVPRGRYKVVIYRDGGGPGYYYEAGGALGPAEVAVPTSTGVYDRANINVRQFGDPDFSVGSFYGRLNVPSTWSSPTVCAVAVNTSGGARAADCGPKGGYFELSGLDTQTDYQIVFTNGRVSTYSQYKSFAGAKKFFGNTGSTAAAPIYWTADDTALYVPVWFYSDVTYKTKNFEAIQFLGDAGVYRPTANTFKPESNMTRRELALYIYRLYGSPAVTIPAKSPFVDVPATDSAYKALLWMRQYKYWTSTTYKPSAALDKRTAAYILWAADGRENVKLPSKSPFKDVKTTDAAYKAIIWATKFEIVPKTSSTVFSPSTALKRKDGALAIQGFWWHGE